MFPKFSVGGKVHNDLQVLQLSWLYSIYKNYTLSSSVCWALSIFSLFFLRSRLSRTALVSYKVNQRVIYFSKSQNYCTSSLHFYAFDSTFTFFGLLNRTQVFML